MKTLKISGLLILCIGLAAVLTVFSIAGEDERSDVEKADAQYEKQNFKDALVAYEKLLKDEPGHEDASRVGLRCITCLFRLRQWDNAVVRAKAYLKLHKGTVWEARGSHALGNLLNLQPHHYYKAKSGQISRGRYLRGAQYHNTTREDYDNAVKSFDLAKSLYYVLEDRNPEEAKTHRAEIVKLNFDYARVLIQPYSSWELRSLRKEEKDPKTHYQGGRFSPAWPRRIRIQALFDEIKTVDPSEDKKNTTLALYRKASFFRAYGNRRPENEPMGLFRSLVRDYPKDKLAPDALFSVARHLDQSKNYLGAKAEYQALLKSYPDSRWVTDCRFYIREMEKPRVTIDTSGVRLPGAESKIKVHTRNLKTVEFAAYPVRLEKIFTDPRNLGRTWRDFFSSFLSQGGAYEHREIQTAEWTLDTGDQADHQAVKREVTVPLKSVGAYVITAKGRTATYESVLVITDLAIVKKTDSRNLYAFVVDAVTGRPVPGAKLHIKERYYQNRSYHVNMYEGRTGEQGLYQQALSGTNSKRYQVFATAGSRYAVTGLDSWNRSTYGKSRQRIYTYTDRPVYRPGHRVSFRSMVRRKADGAFEAVGNTTLLCTITDPKRKKIFEGTLETNEFGSLSGSVTLDKKAPLGMYYIRIKPPHGRGNYQHYGGNRFRVEEYKKPEFKVTVSAGEAQMKVGGKIKVLVNARYYFGAPVAEADVTYRVHRENYRHSHTPQGDYDWLYGRGYGYRPWWRWSYRRWKPANEMVTEGKAKTDAEGNLTFEIDTAPFAEKLPELDHLFKVKAEVRDKSRRTIEGSGSIKVTRNEYYAFITANRGFYQAGERGTFKILTRNAQNDPVASTGKIEVYSLTPRKDTVPVKEGEPVRKYDEKLLLSDDFTIPATGVAFYKWISDSVGRFAIVYRAKDSWGGEVVGRTEVWTVGDEFEGWRFRFADMEILTDKRSYEEGETAQVMISTDHAGAHIFFTLEADNEILEYRILDMTKKSMVIPITMNKRHLPNFFIRAVSFHGGKPYSADREIFVPPTKRFLDINVTADKGEYLPGEKATFDIAVKDHKGKPVHTELSVGVIDTSVLYIQSEFRPDVRKYFYGDMRGKRTRTYNSQAIRFSGFFKDTAYYEKLLRHGNPPGWRGHAWGRPGYLGEERLKSKGGVTFDGGDEEGAESEDSAPSENAEKKSDGMGRRAFGGGARGGGAPPAPTGGPMTSKEKLSKSRKPQGQGPLKKAVVRKNFADTAYWTPAVVTKKDGTAQVTFPFPDSLTTWKTTVVGGDSTARVGQTALNRVTRKNLMVRLQAPRFFIERDEVILSGLVNNYLSTAKNVKVRMKLEGDALVAMGKLELDVDIPAKGEHRADFEVRAVKEGKAVVTIEALTDEESDANQLSFPVYVHGIQKDVTVNGVLRSKRSAVIHLEVPKERNPDATSFELILSPSLASNLLEALPYLIEYPYGCVEQTTSRFIPAVVVARTLKELGINLEDISRKRKDTNAAHLASKLKRHRNRPMDPVFNTAELDEIVKEGLNRLYSFQRSDGTFGWWRHGPYNSYMTAYVTYGLIEAKRAGYNVDNRRYNNAVAAVRRFFPNEKSLHRRCYIAWVLSQAGGVEAKELDLLWSKRGELNNYMRSLLALTYAYSGQAERARTALQNVKQFLKIDEENGTCHLDTGTAYWWYWYNDSIEANAFFLRALLKIDPKSPHVPMLVKWLVTNRKGARWKSTKDTANSIFALMEYVKVEDELNPEYTITVNWPGVGKKEFNVTRSNVFHFDNRFLAGAESVPEGSHDLEITVDGKGSLYFTAHLSYFTKEVGIKGAGHEVFVNRRYFRVKPIKRKEKRGDREVEILDWKRTEVKEGEILKSGERLEVRLDIEAKNNYEYLVFEDPKPAGCEPVQLRSGYSYGNLCSNMELRDEKVAFFVDYLEQGKHAITYQVRAEVPGRFHALPARGYAMYAPRVKGTSDEWIMTIVD